MVIRHTMLCCIEHKVGLSAPLQHGFNIILLSHFKVTCATDNLKLFKPFYALTTSYIYDLTTSYIYALTTLYIYAVTTS